MILLLVLCRSELRGGYPLYSEESTSVNISTQPAHSEPNRSPCSIPQWEISKDGDEQGIPAAQDEHEHKLSTGNADSKDVQSVHAGPEYSVYTGPMDGGELMPMVPHKHNQAPTEPHPGLVGEQAHGTTLYLLEGGTTTPGASGGPKRDERPCEQMKLNKTKTDGNASSSQTSLIQQGPTVIFTDGPLVSGHTVTETPENHIAGAHASPWSWAQKSEPHQTKSRPSLVQSVDFLPTFTSQRPPDLPTTMGKRALSNTRNSSPYKQRYSCGNIIRWTSNNMLTICQSV